MGDSDDGYFHTLRKISASIAVSYGAFWACGLAPFRPFLGVLPHLPADAFGKSFYFGLQSLESHLHS